MITRSNKVKRPLNPVEINKFLGQNDTPDGELGLKLGEATNMYNFRITPNYKLKQREGYTTQISELTGNVQGMWYGKLGGTNFFLFCNNGHLYKLINGVKTDLGTLTDAPTTIFPFGSKVYTWNGYEFKGFDGTTYATVTGYRPKVAIGAPPTGGGTSYEQVNLLNGLRCMTFNGNGTAAFFQLPETSLNSIDYVKVNGTTKTLTTDYTVDLTNGKVTPVTPANFTTGQDNIEIGWTKGSGNRSLIENCRFAMDYSGQTDSRVFLWGNQNYKNRRFWSGLAAGVPSAEYFEANAFDDLGSGQYAITDIVKQYDRQKIYFENGAMWSQYDFTNNIVSFPVYELNDEVGNVAYGQTQIVKNKPLTLYNGVHAWEPTYVRDQTDQKLISQRVQDSITSVDLTTAKTVNWKENQEYWVNVGSIVWIYNYLNDTWYKFDNVQATCFLAVNSELYFGTNGSIQKFDKTKRNDNGTAINAIWEMGFYDFDREWQLKFMNGVWISINPDTNVNLDVQYVTNNDGTSESQSIFYRLLNFAHIDFSHFSFSTSYNPQPFYLEIQAQQFDYIKFILKNSSPTDTVTVLSINMPVRLGGKVR